MKLHSLTMAVLLFSPGHRGALPSRPHSVSDHKNSLGNHKVSVCEHKKPASVAGFLYLRLAITRLSAPFLLPTTRLSLHPRARKLIIQTPCSRYPPA